MNDLQDALDAIDALKWELTLKEATIRQLEQVLSDVMSTEELEARITAICLGE